MSAAPRLTRFLRLPDGRAVGCVVQRDAVPVPTADHVAVIVTLLETGREVDMLLPEPFMAMRPGEFRTAIAARLKRAT